MLRCRCLPSLSAPLCSSDAQEYLPIEPLDLKSPWNSILKTVWLAGASIKMRAFSTTFSHLRRYQQRHGCRHFSSSSAGPSSTQEFLRAGLPFVLFSVLSAWVLKNAIEGRTRESELVKGKASKWVMLWLLVASCLRFLPFFLSLYHCRSERQARMEEEKNEMMDKLNKITSKDFDNTRRIERPEEILERRRKERQARNVWYKRWGRWITGQQ